MKYKNDTIIIREFTPEEFPLFSTLFENENVTRYLPYNAQNQDFAGMCLARVFLDNPEQIEIGYTLGENYWGKGFGTEVCKALVDYCSSLNHKKDIVAVTDLDNIGSQKVLLKSGFGRIESLAREDRELAYFILQKK